MKLRVDREVMMARFPVGTIVGDKTVIGYESLDKLYIILKCNVCGMTKRIVYNNFTKHYDTMTCHSNQCARRTTEEIQAQYPIGMVINDKTIVGLPKIKGCTSVTLKCNVCGVVKTNSINNFETLINTITKHGKSCHMHSTLSSEVIHQAWLGQLEDKLYNTFCAMHNRCENSDNCDYHNYGGRGICVGPEFAFTDEGYNNFITHMYPLFMQTANECIEAGVFVNLEEAINSTRSLTIDRIDVNGNYTIGNVRWATRSIQCVNRRNNIGKEFLAYSPTGEIYYSNSLSLFTKNHSLNTAHVFECLNRGFLPAYTRPSCKGWTFQYVSYHQLFVFNVNNPYINIIREMY